ncbi:PHD finger protein ALFIN-LIKE 4 [Sesamum angolense]|uniref:PHD finger protein ALFIN-LIKE n=1 Tax=Sesamum angolense TaxID=2727404 RepID=A0AAE1XFH2_9LAMI|nr:PHD finger protein ALFIN-LIKE 4 [Sesamum angolense]
MEAGYNPRTVEEVFRDFKGRRAGLIKALTTDVEEFFQQCDPDKENLCLYGFPSEQWEVNLPAEELLSTVMPGCLLLHSFGARFGFDKADRKRLFNMINDLPTVFEVVTGAAKKQRKRNLQSQIIVATSPSQTLNRGHLKLRENIRRHNQRMMKRVWMRKKKMSMERPCVVPVERTMHRTNSGYAVTYVRNGFMESVSRLLLLGLSISSSTSVPHAVTRELARSIKCGESLALYFPKTLVSVRSFLVQVLNLVLTCECALLDFGLRGVQYFFVVVSQVVQQTYSNFFASSQ